MGRPQHFYELSHEGREQFPHRYGEFAVSLLDTLAETVGREEVGTILRKQWERKAIEYHQRIGQGSLQERLANLVNLRQAEGYMAEWHPVDPEAADGSDRRTTPKPCFILMEHNCAISDVAESFPSVCDNELDMYSKLEKTPDVLIEQYFELLTDLPLDRLPENPRDRQKMLALDVVSQYWGEAEAKQAQQTALSLTQGGTATAAEAVPEFSLAEIEFPAKLFYILGASGLCKSGGDGRRQIQGGAVRLDRDRVSDANLTFESPEELHGRVLQVGKKKFIRLMP